MAETSALLVLAASTAAAATSALGVLPLEVRAWRARRAAAPSADPSADPSAAPSASRGAADLPLPPAWIGWGNALAAGLMIGAAWTLTNLEPVGTEVLAALGGALGVLYAVSVRILSRTEGLDLGRQDAEADPAYGYQVFSLDAFHSAAEGVALGVAMAVSPAAGLVVAAAIGVHNIPEAMTLAAVLRSRDRSRGRPVGHHLRVALLTVIANLPQIFVSVAVFAVVEEAPRALPWLSGFAAGALVHLSLVDLMPEAYRRAGKTAIAVVASLALAVLALLESGRGWGAWP